jgi:thiamine-monophosphate kinase
VSSDPLPRRSAETRSAHEDEREWHASLGSGAEFDVIRRMLERWGPRARGIGDDAAVLASPGDSALVASTDTFIENVHFRVDWLSPQEVGYRATAAALSDLAAMGARPLGILAALAIPEHWRGRLEQIADGIGEAAAYANTAIIGGDMSRARELGMTITVLGTAREPLRRTSARPGDRVYVTGRFGGPAAALRELLSGREPRPEHRDRFAHPLPRIAESAWLVEHAATAGIDVSDGLGADLTHLAAASGVSITAELDKVPLVEGVTLLEAAASGEEYELIVTAPSSIDVREFGRRFGIELTEIGGVEHGAPTVRFLVAGEEVDAPSGYSHFTP